MERDIDEANDPEVKAPEPSFDVGVDVSDPPPVLIAGVAVSGVDGPVVMPGIVVTGEFGVRPCCG